MTSKNNLRGFTIVELITVIVIIGILGTIGFVSWNGAQNNAKQNAAKATLGKMKLSLSDYFTDNGYYPLGKTGATASYICSTPATYAVMPAGELYTEFCTGTNSARYLYVATAAGGGACDNSATKCATYTLTAQKEIWNGTTDSTLTP